MAYPIYSSTLLTSLIVPGSNYGVQIPTGVTVVLRTVCVRGDANVGIKQWDIGLGPGTIYEPYIPFTGEDLIVDEVGAPQYQWEGRIAQSDEGWLQLRVGTLSMGCFFTIGGYYLVGPAAPALDWEAL